MPKPILYLSEQLRQFAEIFRSCFSKRQWKYFVVVLLGLIECEERKTMSGLLRVIGEQVSLSGLSRFLNKWNWTPGEVAQSWLLHFRQRMEVFVQAKHIRLKAAQPKRIGCPRQTVVTGFLIFDDSVHVRYWGSTVLNLDAQALVDIPAIRWDLETFFECEKDLLGSDHYQVMKQQAVLRFWTLTACLLFFLEEQRMQLKDQTATCGDVRCKIQNDLRQDLLLWLETCFRDSLPVEQIRYQLALSNS